MKKYIFSIVIIFISFKNYGQSNLKKFDIRTIAFYNLENLFDTVNDTSKNDEASPIMALKDDKDFVYCDKIQKLSEVISQIGREKSNTSPIILGVSEVENKKVLEDLIASKKLKKKKYGIIHFDSPDKRGIDVALLYQKRYFKPIHFEAFNPNIYVNNKKVYTRDILLVSGYLDNELLHIIVNHWPSRRKGQVKTNPQREKAAFKVTQIIERIRKEENNPKIIIMGDFNDDPTNSSFKKVLNTVSNKKQLKKNRLYNPYEDMFRRGLHTLKHRNKLNLFDQILYSEALISKNKQDYNTFKLFKSMVFNKSFLTLKTGKYKGYPFRSFAQGKYTGGYSDHYPVYGYLIKKQ